DQPPPGCDPCGPRSWRRHRDRFARRPRLPAGLGAELPQAPAGKADPRRLAEQAVRAPNKGAGMNPGFKTFLAATAEDRRDDFLGTGRRLGTPEQNIEKDFWVSWTLDALFNGAEVGGPRLMFKGGTSSLKAFGLISRFSEDIDITIFRDDLG